jgi:choline kinase
MQPTRLVVLASGMGSRLRSEPSPKPLVELGGISLVERALAGARQAGFDEVVVVTGHRADQIDRHVLEVSRRRGIAVTSCATSGSGRATGSRRWRRVTGSAMSLSPW